MTFPPVLGSLAGRHAVLQFLEPEARRDGDPRRFVRPIGPLNVREGCLEDDRKRVLGAGFG